MHRREHSLVHNADGDMGLCPQNSQVFLNHFYGFAAPGKIHRHYHHKIARQYGLVDILNVDIPFR
jgi:hypothetical protein